MKITRLSAQVRNPDRVNVFIDQKYRFSLDVAQIIELGIKTGQSLNATELASLEDEGRYSQLYQRALEYVLMRPRSQKEVRDYLWRKTLDTKKQVRTKNRQGEVSYKTIERPGYSKELAERVFDRLTGRGYIDDEKFSRWWIDNRYLSRGISFRKLQAELITKGVDRAIIEQALGSSERDESEELAKVIAKKARRYCDNQKFKQYLARQGFSYSAINEALEGD